MSMSSIQDQLKVPKGQYNGFGKYNYRSCEDIVEAVKPVLAQFEYHLNMSDEVVAVGERVYVKATCRVMDAGIVIAESVGFARESLDKKGMDDSQITGTASSYARKYALNGLFAIDDTKDADTDEHHNTVNQKKAPPAKFDQAMLDKFKACKTTAALRKVWVSLNSEEMQLYVTIKDAAKKRIEGEVK